MAERDLPAWGLPAAPVLTQRLFRMLATEHGAVLNLSKLGQSLGLSHPTVQSYLEYLEGAFLIRRLPPFEVNLRKRLVKSPRIYWRDSGLLHALLRLRPDDDLFAQPWVGASWEGFVIEQVLSVRRARDESLDAYFFRTHDGHEADLVLDLGREREVIEIKLTSGPTTEDLARLQQVAGMVRATRQVLLCRVKDSVTTGDRWVTTLPDYLRACAGPGHTRSRMRPRSPAGRQRQSMEGLPSFAKHDDPMSLSLCFGNRSTRIHSGRYWGADTYHTRQGLEEVLPILWPSRGPFR
jgi:hypothetical protein